MDAVGDVRFYGDDSAMVQHVFGVNWVLLNSEGCVVCEGGVVDVLEALEEVP